MSVAAQSIVAKSGQAGPGGKDVRSDLHVLLETRNQGGIEITLESRVSACYGESILEQSRQILASFGVHHARLTIHDAGALPFVIAARIEAAARRAGITAGKALPEPVFPRAASPRDRLRRSRLYLPGSEPKYFVNAALHAPDAVILDLEDSVHPADKDAARILVRNALRAVDFGACERMVRINQLLLGLEDLEAVIPQCPDLVLLPKTETAEQVAAVDLAIQDLRARFALTHPVWLMPIIESAIGVENAFLIARASPSVVALTIGLEDYTADLGVVKTPDGAESLFARARLVNAAKAAGLQAIDSVFGDVGDLSGLYRWAEASRGLGFEGMGCVHPSQIPVIHAAYMPSPAEIERAHKIVAAFEQARQAGAGVVSLGSKMIDAPVVQRALKLVARAKAMGTPSPAAAALSRNDACRLDAGRETAHVRS